MTAVVALAWHDVTCPEGADCRDRPLHAASAPLANTGILSAFLARFEELSPPDISAAGAAGTAGDGYRAHA